MAGEPLPDSLAAEGRAMRRALAADFAAALGGTTRVVATLDARLPPEPGPWTTVAIELGTCPDRLRELADEADYTLVIAPETRGELERLTRLIEETGTRALGSAPEAVAMAADKAALGLWFEKHGIPTPPSRAVEPMRGLPDDGTFPAVLKPIDGAGSIDTFLINDPKSLPEDARELARGLLQPLVRGQPLSASFLVSPARGARLIAIGGQRIETEGGRFAYRGGRLPVACSGASSILTRAVESVSGLRGFVGVDFIWEPGRGQISVLEINPRPTTSCVGLCRVLPPGRLASAWLAAFGKTSKWNDMMESITREISKAPMVRFGADGLIVLDAGKDAPRC